VSNELKSLTVAAQGTGLQLSDAGTILKPGFCGGNAEGKRFPLEVLTVVKM
jgi:hypothetical protein